jgi:hypothetical protein
MIYDARTPSGISVLGIGIYPTRSDICLAMHEIGFACDIFSSKMLWKMLSCKIAAEDFDHHELIPNL